MPTNTFKVGEYTITQEPSDDADPASEPVWAVRDADGDVEDYYDTPDEARDAAVALIQRSKVNRLRERAAELIDELEDRDDDDTIWRLTSAVAQLELIV